MSSPALGVQDSGGARTPWNTVRYRTLTNLHATQLLWALGMRWMDLRSAPWNRQFYRTLHLGRAHDGKREQQPRIWSRADSVACWRSHHKSQLFCSRAEWQCLFWPFHCATLVEDVISSCLPAVEILFWITNQQARKREHNQTVTCPNDFFLPNNLRSSCPSRLGSFICRQQNNHTASIMDRYQIKWPAPSL